MRLSNAIPALLLGAFAVILAPGTGAAAVTAPPALPSPVTLPTPETYDPTKPGTGTAAPASIPSVAAKLVAEVSRKSGAKSFLWEVKSKTNVIYLFGTIHVGKRAFYPLPPQVEEALKQSLRLVVEADISSSDGMADIDKIINYTAPDSLDKHIPMPLFERLKTQLVRLQIPLAAVKPMKPYLIGGFLSIAEFSKLGYDMNLGVDGYLIAKAKA